MAVAQVVVSGAVLFLLYRYLLRTIGAEQVGVWAVVLATASISKIGEIGLAGSAVKYTAKYLACGDKIKASEVIQTTAIAIGVVLTCVLAAGYPLVVWLLERIVPSPHIPDALAIIPYAMVSTWIGTVAGVYLAGLDGCQRIDLRVLVSMAASALLLGLTWLFVPRHGLVGLAWAQIGQGVLMLCGGWLLLRRELPSLPLIRLKWNSQLFREMFRYGFNFQAITILGMLVDPITKALMTKFGGLGAMAYFDMANRMVAQFRALLVSANQVMVPRVAALHENAPDEIRKVYSDSYRATFFLSLPLYAGVAAVAPLIGELWIGHYENGFVVYAALMAVTYWFNTLVGPAYFVNLGTGALRWNTWSFAMTAVLNVVLGYLFGAIMGGTGVAWGYVIATMAGSSLIVLGYLRDHHMPLATLLPSESKRLLLACCIGLALGWLVFDALGAFAGPLVQAALSAVTCLVVIVPIFWIHPLRESIRSRLALALRP